MSYQPVITIPMFRVMGLCREYPQQRWSNLASQGFEGQDRRPRAGTGAAAERAGWEAGGGWGGGGGDCQGHRLCAHHWSGGEHKLGARRGKHAGQAGPPIRGVAEAVENDYRRLVRSVGFEHCWGRVRQRHGRRGREEPPCGTARQVTDRQPTCSSQLR